MQRNLATISIFAAFIVVSLVAIATELENRKLRATLKEMPAIVAKELERELAKLPEMVVQKVIAKRDADFKAAMNMKEHIREEKE